MSCLIPLAVILRKSESDREKINYLRFMNDINLYVKNENGLKSLVKIV